MARPGASPAGGALPAPDRVGTIAILDIQLPAVGHAIGGHFEGTSFPARVATLQMSDAQRWRWTRAARAAGDSLLRSAGYVVHSVGPPSSDAEPLGGVRFGLSAEITSLSLQTLGRVSPRQVDVSVEAIWELVDLAAGGTILAVRTFGAARLADSVDLAAVLAMTRTLGQLVADTNFLRALATPPARTLEDVIFEPVWDRRWGRPMPGPGDTLRIGAGDQNLAPNPDPVQRVALGVFTVYGARTGSVTAFTITRDGLALASRVPVRAERLWGRFHDGIERPARILRARDDVALLQIKCDTPCPTVQWSDTAAVRQGGPVFIVAGARWAGDALYLADGTVNEFARSDRSARLRISGEVLGGEPVARREDGVVVAIAGRSGAVRIADAFRALGLVVSSAQATDTPGHPLP